MFCYDYRVFTSYSVEAILLTLVSGAMAPGVKVHTEALFSFYSFKFK